MDWTQGTESKNKTKCSDCDTKDFNEGRNKCFLTS